MFEVKVDLHQVSALSPLVFTILLDYSSKEVVMDRGIQLIYANDIAPGLSTEADLQIAITLSYEQLAKHGMKMIKEKTWVLIVTRQQLVPQLYSNQGR